jgi:cytoskeletal protein RodZ
MKTELLYVSACCALLFACAIAGAQTVAQSAPRAPKAPTDAQVMAPKPAQTETPTETDASQTDASRVDKATDPEAPTASHDEVTGRDLPTPSSVPPANAGVSHPDFKTLDVNNRGYLTADDVVQNRWLASNFSRCDANHDGRLSQQEFANCK